MKEGKWIWHWNEGGWEETSYKKGKQHGVYRVYNKDKVLTYESAWEDGTFMKRVN